MTATRKTPAAPHISLTNLFSLALRNMRRHGLRAVVNVAGIAITVAALVFFLSFYRGTYENIMYSSVIDYSTAHGQFMAPSFDDDDPETWLDGKNLFDERIARDGTLAPTASGLTKRPEPILAPRLMTPAFAGDGSRKASIILVGADFAKEAELFAIDGKFVAGGYDGKGAVIGKKLAAILNLGVGDEIRLQATTADGATNLDYWKVSGIYSTGYPPMDRGLAFIDLGQAQNFLGAEGSVNKIYCRVTGEKNAVARDRGVAALVAGNAEFAGLGLTFRNWQEYAKGIVEDAKKDGAFYAIFIAILVFLSFSTMAGTMRVTVFERKREIGMLRASGWLQSEVAIQFLFEALIIGIAGSAAGCVAGGILSLALQLHPIAFGETFANLDIPTFALTCDLQPADFLKSSLAGFLTATLAGFAPALNGARMPILVALSERQG